MGMKKTYSAFLLIALLLSSTGCVRKLTDAELPDYVRRIVVNGIVSNDSVISVEVSSTGDPYKFNDLPKILTTADVALTINDGFAPMTYDTSLGRYVSDRSVATGDKVYMTFKYPLYQEATVRVTVPPVLKDLRSGYVPEGGFDINGLKSDLLQLTFTDNPLARNYYAIRFFYYNEFSQEFLPFEFPPTDPSLVSATTFQLNDGAYVIKDDLFNGKERTISVVAPRGLVAGNTDIKYLVQIVTLTEDYWTYLESLNRYNGSSSGSGLFNNGVVVHSNITNGLGILGAQFVQSDTIR